MCVGETVGKAKENQKMGSQGSGEIVGFCEDEPSPRGVLEIPISGTDSDRSESSSCSSSFNEKSIEDRTMLRVSGLQLKGVFENIKKKSARRLSNIPLLAASYEISRRNFKRLARIRSAEDSIDCEGLTVPKPSWRNFDYAELAAATGNFCPENLVGKGGHAEVYKGRLIDGRLVAVKRLIKKEKDNENNERDRVADFLSELGIIAHIDHPNVAKLLGFGIDCGLYLVLEYSPHGSLYSLLLGGEGLDWKKRFMVAVGIAQGLKYLHHECHRRIIHRDIKASNILLTQNYEALISDFGLAKWLPEKWTHHVVFPIEGTFGYLSPEYFMHGIVDEKTDVFAYGVLLLEIITGRHAVDTTKESLVIWAKPMLDNNNYKELADPRLGDTYDVSEMKRCMVTASMCINHQSTQRPYINRVVQLLKGEERLIDYRHQPLAVRSPILDACDLEDYTCSNYLSDLNRHRQLVME